METTRGAKDVTHSAVCPAYRFCRELKRSHRSSVPDDFHDQQVTVLRDLLQAIKEAAMRLTQLMEKRQAELDSRYRESERCEGNDQRRSVGSEVILTSTSSSVCALCGVALHLKNPSKEFVLDEKLIHQDRDITLKDLDNIFPAKIPSYKTASPDKAGKLSGDFVIHKNVLDRLSPKGSGTCIADVPTREEEKLTPKIRPADASENELKSKLLFIRRIPSDKIVLHVHSQESLQKRDNATQVLQRVDDYCTLQTVTEREPKASEASKLAKVTRQTPKMASFTISSAQDASTLTQEVFCPCSCGLLADEAAKSGISVESLLKEKLVKTKLEELGLHLPAKKLEDQKLHDDARVMKKMKRLEKDKQFQRRKQKIAQLQLQAQIEELHRNIRFFREENELIRHIVEECRRSSMKTGGLQQLLPTRLTYSGLAITIRLLRAKYCSTHGVIATLTEMVRGSMIIQRITEKLLAPFAEHQHGNTSSTATSHSLSASEVEVFLETSSSKTFGGY